MVDVLRPGSPDLVSEPPHMINYRVFQVSGENQSKNVIKHMIRDSNISELTGHFKVKNHPYLTVSNTSKDCWCVISHVSFASSNCESRV